MFENRTEPKRVRLKTPRPGFPEVCRIVSKGPKEGEFIVEGPREQTAILNSTEFEVLPGTPAPRKSR